MTTAKELHNFCNELRNQRREEVKVLLTNWLAGFIANHKRWRAVIGNRKCRPIPIHRDFTKNPLFSNYYILWPDLPDEEIQAVIESLGFVVTGKNCNSFCLSVPPYENGKKLTFAQEWVRKINHNYSVYVAHERKKAEFFYHVILSELCDSSATNVKICNGYTLFEGYRFQTEISSQCYHYIRSLLAKDGIEQYYDECDGYEGLRILQQ